jgi:hypothetical protein
MNKLKIILFLLIILFILYNKRLLYFIVSFIFSKVSPTNKKDIP